MASRTYLPQLQNLARVLCLYVTRYETQIRDNINAETEPILDALLAACSTLVVLLDAQILPGD